MKTKLCSVVNADLTKLSFSCELKTFFKKLNFKEYKIGTKRKIIKELL